jgi:predicted nucleic acid-binding protein
MDQCLVEDSSFLISVLLLNDPNHSDAVETLGIISNKEHITTVFPEIVLCETAFTLMKLGVSPDSIRKKINDLTMFPKVILLNNNPLSALRYISRHYNALTQSQNSRTITKTQDYLIACACKDVNGILISSDTQMIGAVSTIQSCQCINFTIQADRDNLKQILNQV